MMQKNQNKIYIQIFGEKFVSSDSIDKQADKNNTEKLIANNTEKNMKEGSVLSGIQHSIDKSKHYNDIDTDLTSSDIDADWADGSVTGDETSSSDNETPDQDIVDDVAKPWGLEYQNNEELNIRKKNKQLRKKRQIDENKKII